VVLAVGFGVANGRPRNRKNIARRLICSHRLRYIQSCVSRFTSREAQTTGVSILYLTQAKVLTKPHLELLRLPTLDRALLRFLLVAKMEPKVNLPRPLTPATSAKIRHLRILKTTTNLALRPGGHLGGRAIELHILTEYLRWSVAHQQPCVHQINNTDIDAVEI
jgi:hypothetical protein